MEVKAGLSGVQQGPVAAAGGKVGFHKWVKAPCCTKAWWMLLFAPLLFAAFMATDVPLPYPVFFSQPADINWAYRLWHKLMQWGYFRLA